MWRYFTANNTLTYVRILPQLVKGYNSDFHRSIKMAPKDVNESHEHEVWLRLYGALEDSPRYRFRVGDKVRITKVRGPFAKSYEQGWTDEIFTIYQRLPRSPPVYKIKDYGGDVIKGTFYGPELQKIIKEDEVYKVEKIIRKRKRGKKQEFFVKWLGYPESMNSWIDAKDVQTQ